MLETKRVPYIFYDSQCSFKRLLHFNGLLFQRNRASLRIHTLVMICFSIVARWLALLLALLLAFATKPVTSDDQVIRTLTVNQPNLVRRQPTCDVS